MTSEPSPAVVPAADLSNSAEILKFPSKRKRHARTSSGRAASAARASSVTSLRPPSSLTSADQYSGGIARRARQVLTVDFATDKEDANCVVPPSESMMVSTVMPTEIVRITRTSQEFANRETTFLQGRGSLAGMIDPPEIIGPRLKALRIALGFPRQNKFAAAIGVEKNTYNPWEKGTRPLTFESACTIRQKFQIPLDYLFYGAQEDAIPAKYLEKLRAAPSKHKAA